MGKTCSKLKVSLREKEILTTFHEFFLGKKIQEIINDVSYDQSRPEQSFGEYPSRMARPIKTICLFQFRAFIIIGTNNTELSVSLE